MASHSTYVLFRPEIDWGQEQVSGGETICTVMSAIRMLPAIFNPLRAQDAGPFGAHPYSPRYIGGVEKGAKGAIVQTMTLLPDKTLDLGH